VQWWRVVGAIGRLMMRAGVLVLLFVAYQLWGTGLATDRAQSRLEDEFATSLAEATPSTTSTTATDDPTATPSATFPSADLPPPEPGDPVARVRIPTIGVDYIVVQGVDLKWLKEGPGHFPQTPLPGQPGNVALAGHRTTYAAPFNRLDELEPGDEITFETVQGTFTYTVDGHETQPGEAPSGHFIVAPDQVEVLEQGGGDRVTLVACHPKYSARQRIIVTGTLATTPAPPTPLPEADGDGSVTTDASIDALVGGDSSARGPAILWSALALGVWFLTWAAARRWPIWHKVPVYVVGTPIFFVVLFVAYENIARLLPASY
jgi:sortase A